MSVGHVSRPMDINRKMENELIEIMGDAEFLNGTQAPKRRRRKRESDIVNNFTPVAFHMPKADDVYDMIALLHQLQSNLIDLRREYRKS